MPHTNKSTVDKNKELIDELDKSFTVKNNQKIIQKFKERLDTHLTKEGIDKFIENISKEYNTTNCCSVNFNNWNSLEIIKSKLPNNNPNDYIDGSNVNALTADYIYHNMTYNSNNKKEEVIPIVKTKIIIDMEINTLDDLLILIANNPVNDINEYNINMLALTKIHPLLLELNGMIGLKEMKNNVVDQILYFIQGLHNNNNSEKNTTDKVGGDFMHTVIYGPPGTGKTEIAKIIGQIFSKLGILKNNIFKKVTRSDLIAGYLGQTATKTRDVINDCIGGVLFIDEAYALGNNEKRDIFAKECIDTLCEALSNHKSELMVIIAGYETELKDCFFSYNQGLDSRFTWRFKMDEYKGEELYKIFIKKITDINWSIYKKDVDSINIAWFDKKLPYFKFFGRDIETLLLKTKIIHSRRVFCKPPDEKMKITLKDLNGGFELYIKNEEVKNRKESAQRENVMKSLYV